MRGQQPGSAPAEHYPAPAAVQPPHWTEEHIGHFDAPIRQSIAAAIERANGQMLRSYGQTIQGFPVTGLISVGSGEPTSVNWSDDVFKAQRGIFLRGRGATFREFTQSGQAGMLEFLELYDNGHQQHIERSWVRSLRRGFERTTQDRVLDSLEHYCATGIAPGEPRVFQRLVTQMPLSQRDAGAIGRRWLDRFVATSMKTDLTEAQAERYGLVFMNLGTLTQEGLPQTVKVGTSEASIRDVRTDQLKSLQAKAETKGLSDLAEQVEQLGRGGLSTTNGAKLSVRQLRAAEAEANLRKKAAAERSHSLHVRTGAAIGVTTLGVAVPTAAAASPVVNVEASANPANISFTIDPTVFKAPAAGTVAANSTKLPTQATAEIPTVALDSLATSELAFAPAPERVRTIPADILAAAATALTTTVSPEENTLDKMVVSAPTLPDTSRMSPAEVAAVMTNLAGSDVAAAAATAAATAPLAPEVTPSPDGTPQPTQTGETTSTPAAGLDETNQVLYVTINQQADKYEGKITEGAYDTTLLTGLQSYISLMRAGADSPSVLDLDKAQRASIVSGTGTGRDKYVEAQAKRIIEALDTDEYGNWKGLSKEEREVMASLMATFDVLTMSQEQLDKLVPPPEPAADEAPGQTQQGESQQDSDKSRGNEGLSNGELQKVADRAFGEYIEKLARQNPDAMNAFKLTKLIIEGDNKYKDSGLNRYETAAQLWSESAFDPRAGSSAGAKGIAQFIDPTWTTWGKGKNVYDPAAAIDANYRFMDSLYKLMKERFPKASHDTLTTLAFAGYNAGPYNQAVLEGRVPQNGETNVYVDRINSLADDIESYVKKEVAEAREKAQRKAAAKEREAAEDAAKQVKGVYDKLPSDDRERIAWIKKNVARSGGELHTAIKPRKQDAITKKYGNGNIPKSAMVRVDDRGHYLEKTAGEAFMAMARAYKAETGHDLLIGGDTSAYRSYEEQVETKQSAIKKGRGGFAAKPGTSRHGVGLAVDLGPVASSYDSRAYKWLKRRGPDFGFFHQPFHAANSSTPEPWHWEYLG